jgi:hypothetical protein
MKKRVATKKVYSYLEKKYQSIIDKALLRKEKVFLMKKGAVLGIKISGATLRKIYEGKYIHENTIIKSLEQFGKKWDFKNGKIDIENEGNNISS